MKLRLARRTQTRLRVYRLENGDICGAVRCAAHRNLFDILCNVQCAVTPSQLGVVNPPKYHSDSHVIVNSLAIRPECKRPELISCNGRRVLELEAMPYMSLALATRCQKPSRCHGLPDSGPTVRLRQIILLLVVERHLRRGRGHSDRHPCRLESITVAARMNTKHLDSRARRQWSLCRLVWPLAP